LPRRGGHGTIWVQRGPPAKLRSDAKAPRRSEYGHWATQTEEGEGHGLQGCHRHRAGRRADGAGGVLLRSGRAAVPGLRHRRPAQHRHARIALPGVIGLLRRRGSRGPRRAPARRAFRHLELLARAGQGQDDGPADRRRRPRAPGQTPRRGDEGPRSPHGRQPADGAARNLVGRQGWQDLRRL